MAAVQKVSIEALARQQLERAASTGRNAADTVVGGHERILRQTVVGMTAGSEMSEHANPGEATIFVLRDPCGSSPATISGTAEPGICW